MFHGAFVGSDRHLIDRICRGVFLAPKIYLYLTMAIAAKLQYYVFLPQKGAYYMVHSTNANSINTQELEMLPTYLSIMAIEIYRHIF